jgi:hypothetical protein
MISIVVPACNEEGNLDVLYERARDELAAGSWAGSPGIGSSETRFTGSASYWTGR